MGKLLEELAKAQLEFKPINKSGENPFLHNKYATLDDIVNAIKDALANHGISIIHRTEERGAKTFFISEVKHFEDAESEMSTETAIDTFLKVSDKQTAIQIYGSIITYLRRYHIGMLLNLCTDEDIDGNDSKSGGKTITQGESTTTKPSATQGKVDPQQADSKYKTTEDYITRINGGKLSDDDKPIDTLEALKGWQKKHQPEINKMPTDTRMSIMKVFQERHDLLKKAESITQDETDLLGDGEKEHKDPA